MKDSGSVQVARGIFAGSGRDLLVIAGPCVIESVEVCLQIGGVVKDLCSELGLPYVFKASFDKANRTSMDSYRGPGLDRGLEILGEVKRELGIPVLTDVHESAQVDSVAEVVDVLQIPAFLCRQTDLLIAAGRTGRAVNLKKGQFLAPEDILPAVEKIHSTGNSNVMVTERGTSFGYHNLVVDMRSPPILARLGINAIIFDTTHSVQLPGGRGGRSGGEREYIGPLSRAAAAVGIHGIFLEVHPDPPRALCDGDNSLFLDDLRPILEAVKQIHDFVARDNSE